MDSCFDIGVDYVITVFATIHIVSDILFACELKRSQISCEESCDQDCSNQGCSPSDMTCSNGLACPGDPKRLYYLFIACIVFIVLPAFFACFLLYIPLSTNEEKYIAEEKKGTEEYIRPTNAKKKISVLVNGDKIGTFYIYVVYLCRSREAVLQKFRQFDSKIQKLKQWTALLPIYGFCHFLHFLALANNTSWIAKIVFPKQTLPDQEAMTPAFRMIDSPDDSLPRVKLTPAVLIAQRWRMAQINFHFIFGILMKSGPQWVIQMIYLLSTTGEGQGVSLPICTALFTGINTLGVVLYMLAYQLREESTGEVMTAESGLRMHLAQQGHNESEIRFLLEPLGDSDSPTQPPQGAV
jgi:hypothetical protein